MVFIGLSFALVKIFYCLLCFGVFQVLCIENVISLITFFQFIKYIYIELFIEDFWVLQTSMDDPTA